MPIAVGLKAPDFTLRSKSAAGLADVALSNEIGQRQIVLLFFPAAFSRVCTQEFCDLTSGFSEYAQLNAAVFGISVDTPYALEAWAKQNNITIPLLSDLNKVVISAYDVVFPMFAGAGDVAARAAFVIGLDGIIKYAEQTATPGDLPNFSAVRAALSK